MASAFLPVSPTLRRHLGIALSLLVFQNLGGYAYGQNEASGTGIYSGKVVLCGTQRQSDTHRRIELLDPTALRLQEVAVFKKEVPVALSVSPSGNYLAVTVVPQDGGKNKASLIVMDSKQNRRVIAEDVDVVAWSPDETQLLVRRGEKYKWSNAVIDVKNGRTHDLPLPATDAAMDWSPSGALSVMAGRPKRVFEQRPGEFYPKRQLYFFNLESMDAEAAFTHPDEDCIKGQFSGDGNKLAYSRRTYSSGTPVELCETLDLKSLEHQTIVDFTSLGVRPNLNPLWSKDAKQVLWQISRNQDEKLEWELWFMPTDGSARRIVRAEDLGLSFFGLMDWK